jgi:hypothetical protein
MTRGEIKAAFTAKFNRRDLSGNTALVDTFIDEAIMRVQRELRCPAMEKTIDVTIASDYSGLVIPSDMLELKYIRPAASQTALKKRTLDQALNAAFTNGIPLIYAREGGAWVLGPTPATGDVIRVVYYAELSPLVADSDSNIISEIAWDLILYAALQFAALHYIDKRKDDFEATFQTILMDLQDQSDEDELAFASVEPGLGYPPDDPSYEAIVID